MIRILIGCVNLLFFLDSILAQTMPTPPPIISDDSEPVLPFPNGIQLVKFSELRHQLRSGPIVIVNKNTFFVPNLHYDGFGPDAHFWVGNGTGPDTNGILVPDENGSRESLKAYNGQNVYITLPDGITTDSIDYFGLWCIKFTQNFGYVTIPKNIVVPPIAPDYRMTGDNKYIIRVQKCCPINEAMDYNFQCVVQNQKFDPQIDFLSKIDIRIGTNANDVIVPFTNNIVCTEKEKSLRTIDGISLFINGTILKNQVRWSQDEYCMETYNLNNETNPSWKTVTIVCDDQTNQISPSNVPKIASISVLVLVLTFFSIIC